MLDVVERWGIERLAAWWDIGAGGNTVNRSHLFEKSISPQYCARCGNGPGHSLHLGDLFEETDEDRAKALASSQREEMETRLRSFKGDISSKAGDMERFSPLFYGQGDNPTLF